MKPLLPTMAFFALVLTSSRWLKRYRRSKTERVGSITNKAEHGTAKVYLVGAGPGALDLITLRALNLVKEADVMMNDRLVSPKLLEFCKPQCKILNVGKSSEKERFSQKQLEEELIQEAFKLGEGGIIVRLKGGDPYIYGLGASEGQALHKAGIEWEYVPGLSSAIALPGLCLDAPLTHKGVSSGFVVLSGHVPPKDDSEWAQLPKVKEPLLTLVVVMCAKNLQSITEYLQQKLGWDPLLPCAVIQSGSTEQERILKSTLQKLAADAAANNIDEAPLSLVVGRSCALFDRKGVSASQSITWESPDVWGSSRTPSKVSVEGLKANSSSGALAPSSDVGAEIESEWWVFGYGSLIWRPSEDVPHVEVEDGFIQGYIRRFWQESPDHRGTPESPGRVATILPLDIAAGLVKGIESVSASSTEKVFGRVYRVDPTKMVETRERLIYREKAGYEERIVEVTCKDGRKIKASVFLAMPNNEHFVGPETPQQIAERIHRSIGPSGKNIEYLEELVQALHQMKIRWGDEEETVVDAHLTELMTELNHIRTAAANRH